MTKNNCITEKRTFKQLTDIQRGMLEQMAKSGTYKQAEMARELGVSQPTVSRELKRGRTRQLDYKRNYYEQYIAASGARVYKENRENSHARNHHKYSDGDKDLHSPVKHGFWWSHVGWFMSDIGFKTDYSVIKDYERFPELRFLNRFDALVPALFAICMYAFGELLGAVWPATGTSGWQMVVWAFFISTVILFHATFTINSLGHVWGRRRFSTKDRSRNNAFLAVLTLGEGWHNNHHRFAVSARQGFYWWEVDVSYMLLKIMSWMGIVRDLNPVPTRILKEGRNNDRVLNEGQVRWLGK